MNNNTFSASNPHKLIFATVRLRAAVKAIDTSNSPNFIVYQIVFLKTKVNSKIKILQFLFDSKRKRPAHRLGSDFLPEGHSIDL